ncbi:MAG TPA: DUF2784 domain-containing protein [Nitrospira sp.]
MWYSLLADLIVLLHFAFVMFVLFGGLLTVKWPRVVWIHGPAFLWGCIVEFTGTVCPLTPLENQLRMQGGEAGYEIDFISRWVLPILYPESLTPSIQLVLGAFVLVLNVAIYAWIWRSRLINRPDR